MDVIMSTWESDLTEQLLPSKHSFLFGESRSDLRYSNLSGRTVFQAFSINFFTYGFPVLLLALTFWSFYFASLCSFGLLAYVGYVLYAFPSVFLFHRLNGLLLVFILLWTASTYVFNLAFAVLNMKLRKDMEIWETFGLWHYPIPGFYLLAQFCLGILVAMANLVNSSVFLFLSNQDRQLGNDNHTVEDEEEMKVFIIATIAWGLRKCSRTITLCLIFIIAVKPGLTHAVYMIFFLVYLLSHSISKKICQSLILLCEVHFALLYILHLNLISKVLDQKGSFAGEILKQLGLYECDQSGHLLKIAMLGCFCALHNHGIEMLFRFSNVVQQTSFPPIGFSILRAGLIKSVLFSVYTSRSREKQHEFSSNERKIMIHLGAIGEKFLSVYRSCGSYIAFFTILVALYLVTPNYASFGYLFFLLLWIIGRQLLEKTMRHLWLPLQLYAIAIFVFIYCLSVFDKIRTCISNLIDLYVVFGYNPEASPLENVRQSLAVLVAIQLFSYERRRSKHTMSTDGNATIDRTITFLKRLLIWHVEKILYLAVLYTSLSPVSGFGFLYLLFLVFCSTLPKSSRIPSKLFLVYSGCVAMTKYLFQMLGDEAEMFAGQKNSYFSLFLGLQLYKPGFWGLESGLRGEVLVIFACMLHYNIFHWLDKMPHESNIGRWDEACTLFGTAEEILSEVCNLTKETASSSSPLLDKGSNMPSHSWASSNSGISGNMAPISSGNRGPQGRKSKEYLYTYFWESCKGSNKWNRKRILFFRMERLHKQKKILKVYLKLYIENMFSLFGLEINMVALLLAGFAVLNSISLLYVASLAACVLLHRNVLQKLWPMFVFLFASIVTLEYLALWSNLMSKKQDEGGKAQVRCHDCWRFSDHNFEFCKSCWLGIIVDDPRMLISYYVVFMFSCFKLRANHLSDLPRSQMYQQLISRCKNTSLLSDLSFETKELWTLLDYLRHYSYCHLLDLVLALILITGTLEYDVLHLGYLGFALIFFRMRLDILKKKNRIFKFLRIYNFSLIVLSLAYQSPLIGDFIEGKFATVVYIGEVIGFYKYDYGFRITSRSALVEIIIFMLVSLQSFMFSSEEFDYVSKYLEAEQIGAIVREQEKRTAWKTAQLQNIRRSEELKRLRNLQVEKMKSEMLNLQNQLQSMIPSANSDNKPPKIHGLRRRNSSKTYKPSSNPGKGDDKFMQPDTDPSTNLVFAIEMNESPKSERSESLPSMDSTKPSLESLHEMPKHGERDVGTGLLDLERSNKANFQAKENPIISAVHLIGDGVSQVQSLGNYAVANLVTLLNIENEKKEMDGQSSEDEVYYEIESHNAGCEPVDQAFVTRSVNEWTASSSSCLQLGAIIRYMWAQMRSNNDVVCYCCFVLMFLWNFSVLSMVYLAALFLYALCVNIGPSYMFWVIMLIYSEVCILLQYLYQIVIQHCDLSIETEFLQKIGFPADKIVSFFVIGNLPLFLVYIFTLLQTSIMARDGDWRTVTKFSIHGKRNKRLGEALTNFSFKERIYRLLLFAGNLANQLVRGLYRYWKSLTTGAETPPYFVQVSLEVKQWPEDGIQPERIESGMNELLRIIHDRRCKKPDNVTLASRIRIQSIERSTENPNIALAVFEVLYASPSTESTPGAWHKSLTPAADVSHEILINRGAGILEEVGFPYPIISVIGGGKREIDLYAYIFCADLAVFFLVAIFYQSIIKNKSEFLEVYQLEDQFPKEYVFILMIVFFLIVLDRVIYLCSFATGKVIFYLFSLGLFTYSVTNYAWYTALPIKHPGRLALRAIFLTKAVSLALQAVQIRFGIPHESTLYRQFLTSSVSQLNLWGFRLYRALPFLYELRCVLDWSCTSTSLTMYDWLKLEDIHASLFLVKCDADLNRARHQHGQKQTKMTKFCGGICLFSVLLCVIWAPMLMYSSGNPTNIANPIEYASARVNIETESGKLTLFETTLCEKLSWDELDSDHNLDPLGYLSAYNVKDVQVICCQADASTLWLVPPVVQARFIKSLRWSMKITFSWQLTRDRPKGKEVVKYELDVDDFNLPSSSEVMEVLNGTANSFTIYDVYPRFFRVTGSGDVRLLEPVVVSVSGDLVLNRGHPGWWSFHDTDAPNIRGCGTLAGPMAIVISEETPQGILGETLSKFSIWGLYITFVLAVGRFIRLQCADLRMRIPYENLPSCDRLLAICEDIYAARAEGELEVEEVLYWTLVKIYRSPHMLLEYTKRE
ncbi:piezo-type mechanosensitive ion channel homolog isoform X2 [Rhodamnia argentea]|nr:piezo-type mechanosensitive ion channel homolog isoform X2 [Rhodamnia argentea]